VTPECGDDAARFGLRLVDQAGREVRATAAQRTRRLRIPGSRPRNVDAAPGLAQHVDRGTRVLGLEVVAERVDEQHDVGVMASVVATRRDVAQECIRPKSRERTPGGNPEPRFRQLRRAGE
jgi:hypothetical protein